MRLKPEVVQLAEVVRREKRAPTARPVRGSPTLIPHNSWAENVSVGILITRPIVEHEARAETRVDDGYSFVGSRPTRPLLAHRLTDVASAVVHYLPPSRLSSSEY